MKPDKRLVLNDDVLFLHGPLADLSERRMMPKKIRLYTRAIEDGNPVFHMYEDYYSGPNRVIQFIGTCDHVLEDDELFVVLPVEEKIFSQANRLSSIVNQPEIAPESVTTTTPIIFNEADTKLNVSVPKTMKPKPRLKRKK